MKGVINLRGGVVPVVDLRLKFGMAEAEKTVNTCIIIVEVSLDGESAVLGALADSVQEVFEFEHDQIEPAPKIGTKLKTDFIKGMGKRDDEFIKREGKGEQNGCKQSGNTQWQNQFPYGLPSPGSQIPCGLFQAGSNAPESCPDNEQ